MKPQTLNALILLNAILSALIIIFLIWGGVPGGGINTNSKFYFSDTTIIKERPVNKSITYNNISPIKETIIKEAKIDTLALVNDYLKARYYSDSTKNDTIKINWLAKVSKNKLDSLKLNYTFYPKSKVITNYKETKSPAFGFYAAYNGKFGLGPSITLQNNNFVFTGGYDVLNKGGFIGANYKIKRFGR